MADVDKSLEAVELALTALGLVPAAWATAEQVQAAIARFNSTKSELEAWKVMTRSEKREALREFGMSQDLWPLELPEDSGGVAPLEGDVI